MRIIGVTRGKSEVQLGETAIDVSKYYNKTHHKLDLGINHPAFKLVCKLSIVDLTKGIDFNVDVQSVMKNEKLQSISAEDAMKIRANSLVYHKKKEEEQKAKTTTTSVDVTVTKTVDGKTTTTEYDYDKTVKTGASGNTITHTSIDVEKT